MVARGLRGARIYVEGADREDLRRSAREAFTRLFEPVLGPRRPSFIFCGSRLDTFKAFQAHLRERRPEQALLVVDAEDVVETSIRWRHVAQRRGDHWRQPRGTTEDDLRFMAVVMETWCLVELLPARELERITKDEVFSRLKKTGWTKEGSNSFELVARIDLARLRQRSPEFSALCSRLHDLSA